MLISAFISSVFLCLFQSPIAGSGQPPNKPLLDSKQTQLLHAIAHNDSEKIATLLKSGAKINGTENDPDPPLFYARRTPEMFYLLLSLGADPNVISATGENVSHAIIGTPLSSNTAAEFLVALDHFGLKPDSRNRAGQTALHTAIEYLDSNVVATLLSLGYSATAIDKLGRTPLHDLALRMGKPSGPVVLSEVLAMNYSTNACLQGRIPLSGPTLSMKRPVDPDFTFYKVERQVWILLRRNGANPSQKDAKGMTCWDLIESPEYRSLFSKLEASWAKTKR